MISDNVLRMLGMWTMLSNEEKELFIEKVGIVKNASNEPEEIWTVEEMRRFDTAVSKFTDADFVWKSMERNGSNMSKVAVTERINRYKEMGIMR